MKRVVSRIVVGGGFIWLATVMLSTSLPHETPFVKLFVAGVGLWAAYMAYENLTGLRDDDHWWIDDRPYSLRDTLDPDHEVSGPELHTEWHENGSKKAEGKHIEGQKDGRWTFWYDSGGVKRVCAYSKGMQVGKLTDYHPSGSVKLEKVRVMSEGPPEQGVLTQFYDKQRWRFWTKYGKVRGKNLFVDDQLHGPCSQFLKDGTKTTGQYRNGLKHGEWKTTNPDGSIFLVRTFLEGDIQPKRRTSR